MMKVLGKSVVNNNPRTNTDGLTDVYMSTGNHNEFNLNNIHVSAKWHPCGVL